MGQVLRKKGAPRSEDVGDGILHRRIREGHPNGTGVVSGIDGIFFDFAGTYPGIYLDHLDFSNGTDQLYLFSFRASQIQ